MIGEGVHEIVVILNLKRKAVGTFVFLLGRSFGEGGVGRRGGGDKKNLIPLKKLLKFII